MKVYVSDERWAVLADQIKGQGVLGRPRADDRTVLNAILHVLVSSCRWNDLPREYGHYSTAWRRFENVGRPTARCCVCGATYSAAWMPRVSWTGSTVPWMARTCRPKKGGDQVGCPRAGKTSKRHALVEGHGLPLALVLTGSQVHELTAVGAVLASVRVPRPRGRPRTRPGGIAADRGYEQPHLPRRPAAARHPPLGGRAPTAAPPPPAAAFSHPG